MPPPSPHSAALIGAARAAYAAGDLVRAEQALRAALAADRRAPAVHAALGDLLHHSGRVREAEKAYRAGLAVNRRDGDCASGLTHLLIGQGRLAEALQVSTPIVAGDAAPASVLDAHAEALSLLERPGEALAYRRRAVAAGSPFGAVRLAGTLCDLGRLDEAEAAAMEALSALGEHPAAMTVLGRIHWEQGRLEAAEAAYRQVLAAAPLDPETHRALANVVWLRSGEVEAAGAALDAALRQARAAPLVALKATLLAQAGRREEAAAFTREAAARSPEDALVQAAAATAAVRAGEVDAGLTHAERAVALAPGEASLRMVLAETLLAAGQPERASDIAGELLRARPHDQSLLALQSVSWRLLGDPRLQALNDYEAVVGVFTLPTPAGWPTLPAFLHDLAARLKGLHGDHAHPLEQSLRQGSQTQADLSLSDAPELKAFFAAADGPVRDYLARIGKGRDPLRARNTGRYRVKSAWSVSLRPNGFHLDHLHPGGWLSSAFYVELPKVMEGGQDRQGWLKFGEPALSTRPALAAEYFVRPEPGRLVLFPSYLWHGTVPFGGDQPRLTMAFDMVPA